MTSKFKALTLFQFILIEMQSKIATALANGADKEKVEMNIRLFDKLRDVYSQYDSFYFDSEYNADRSMMKDIEIIDLCKTIVELQNENDKLKKQLEWNM